MFTTDAELSYKSISNTEAFTDVSTVPVSCHCQDVPGDGTHIAPGLEPFDFAPFVFAFLFDPLGLLDDEGETVVDDWFVVCEAREVVEVVYGNLADFFGSPCTTRPQAMSPTVTAAATPVNTMSWRAVLECGELVISDWLNTSESWHG